VAAVAAAYGNRKTRLPLARYANRKGYRDALNLTHGATMAGHVIGHAVQSGGIAPDEIDDVVLGCAMPRGATGYNIARFAPRRPAGYYERCDRGPPTRFQPAGNCLRRLPDPQ